MILHSSASTAVSLSEDLAALQLYMELESLRFEQKFDFKIECDPDLDADFIHVPPMLLQPYVENAIWHGLMLKKDKGNLWVNISQERSNLICTVTDNGIGRKKAAEFKSMSASEHKSMGMSITAGRIALLDQQKQAESSVQITDLVFPDGSPGGTEVVIKIPVSYD
jgi:LytS/YehU family sensor histidine kinase